VALASSAPCALEILNIPNLFAYIALFSWPAVCLIFFVRMSTEKAVLWSFLGAYMLLPSDLEVNPPGLPPFDKMAVASAATILLCWMKGSQASPPRRSILIYLFAIGYVLTPIFTSFDNSYELQTAGKSIQGFYPLDGLKFAGRNLLVLIPFHIGSRFLSTDRARMLLLKALPSAMLFYSLPMLLEVRLSPQIHRWIYGYFPGDLFVQQMRDGGFRPVVFFPHGLTLALFTCLAVLSGVVFVRMKSRILGIQPTLVTVYLGGLLLLCKTFGAALYALLLTPVVLLSRPRAWVKLSCAASLLLCAYPLLRSHGLAPTQLMATVAQVVSPQRAASFTTRVENEEQLLQKANQKPVFGWGGWGRNRIFDQETGRDISITDGGWIIYFGISGWVGFLSLFGLLAAAQFRALRAIDKEMTPATLARGGLSLLLAILVIDSVPNGSQLPLMLLLAGSIASSATLRRPVPLNLGKSTVPRALSEPALTATL
jgi:hypothetical protein